MPEGRIVIGKVRPVFRGDYDAARAYSIMDRVRHEGNLFEAAEDVPAGTEPKKEGSAYWLLLSANSAPPEAKWNGTSLYFEYPDGTLTDPVDLKGVTGDQGAPGEPGADGKTISLTSDWTGEDPDVAFSALGAKNMYEALSGANSLEEIRGDVQSALTKSTNAQTLAGEANATAASASLAATEAKSDANSAKTKAESAQDAATSATTVATEAKTAAQNAVNAANGAITTSSNAKDTADSAATAAQAAQITANAAVPKSGARGSLAGNETASALTGSQTINANSADCINISTSGAVTLTFTPAAANIRAVKALSLTASAATTLTISGAVWASKGSAPTWGNAGTILVLLAHFVGGRVVLSVADNTQ